MVEPSIDSIKGIVTYTRTGVWLAGWACALQFKATGSDWDKSMGVVLSKEDAQRDFNSHGDNA